MEWHKFTKKTLPEVSNDRYFLLYRGKNDPGGGVMCLAKRVQYDGKEPYIRFITPFDGWELFDHAEWRSSLWSEIDYP